MSKVGIRIIGGLQEVLAAIREARPVRQSVVRRMTVKGRTVHVRDTFNAPVTLPRRRPRK